MTNQSSVSPRSDSDIFRHNTQLASASLRHAVVLHPRRLMVRMNMLDKHVRMRVWTRKSPMSDIYPDSYQTTFISLAQETRWNTTPYINTYMYNKINISIYVYHIYIWYICTLRTCNCCKAIVYSRKVHVTEQRYCFNKLTKRFLFIPKCIQLQFKK